MILRILPPEEMIDTAVKLPLSKSICNRLLIINALTPSAEPLPEIAEADDSRLLSSALEALAGGQRLLNAGAAGTAMRFLTALLAAAGPHLPEGTQTLLDGSERMRQRPIGPLVDALRTLGAEIAYEGNEGCPPLRITARRLSGGAVNVDATVSSQFISALMMIAPLMDKPLTINLQGEPASRPYIDMTAALMTRAGVDVDAGRDAVTISPGNYKPCPQTIEPDWSAASYWYSICALSAGFIVLDSLSSDSIQGDRRCASFFEMLGVNTAPFEPDDYEGPEELKPRYGLQLSPSPEQFSRFEVDLTENPDLAQGFAVASAMLGIPFHLRGLATLKNKETDRLEAMRAEMDKLGFIVEVRSGSELVWNGQRHPIFELPRIATYNDHRMALAFAPAAIYIPGLEIADAEVVSKSYPQFWDQLRAAGFIIEEVETEPTTEADAK